MAEYQPEVVDYPLELHKTGKIICRIHGGLAWCKDIEEAIQKGYDSKFLWDHNNDHTELSSRWQLQIPVFPTAYFFETVILDDQDAKRPRYAATWIPLEGADAGNEYWLGFITPGEGRASIRGLIIEQLWAKADVKAQCKSSMHGLNAETRWQQDLRGPKMTAQRWSVWRTGLCLTCLTATRQSMDDLVPAEERKGTWNKDIRSAPQS